MNYVFLDLETTGLDPDKNVIVEIGIVVTDNDFYPIDCFTRVIKTEAKAWEDIPEVVDKMHTNNGLKHLSVQAFQWPVNSVENEALNFLANFSWNPEVVLCGNTVHFDRAFLKVHMPDLESWFHYRNFDVSTMKQLIRNLLPDYKFPGDNDERHRALPDAIMSAREMTLCKVLLYDGLRWCKEDDTV